MTHTFLTVHTLPTALGKQSLSCGDIPALAHASATEDGQSKIKQRRNSLKPEEILRFLRPKSPQSMKRKKSRSCSCTLDDIDRQLIQIKENLSKFREQDVEFRERLHSLNSSIGELTSRSPSEVSSSSDLSVLNEDNYEEENCEDDQCIDNDINGISMSFSSEVLDSIPVIAVTSDNRWQS